MSNLPQQIWNFVKDLPSMIWEFVKSIPSMVWELFKALLNGISDTIKLILDGIVSIVQFVANFFSYLLDFVKDVFIPDDGYLIKKFDVVLDILEDKFKIDFSVFNQLKNVGSSAVDDIPVTVMGVKTVIKMDFVNSISTLTRTISTGCVVLFSVLYNYNKVMYILRGRYAIETSKGSGN